MFSLNTAKLAINIVASLGVSKIVGDVVKNNVFMETPVQKVIVKTGEFVIGSMLIDHACNHVNNSIDKMIRLHEERKAAEVSEAAIHPVE